MALSERRKGEWYIFFGTFLGGFFPVITVLSFETVPSLISLGWCTLIAALFFGIIVTYKRRWGELGDPRLWRYVFYITVSISILYYGLFFIGLTKTLPGNAAIIDLFAVFTTFVFFNVLRGEHISSSYKVGALLMVIGACIVLARDFSGVNVGDVLILAATACVPIGNLFQQKARLIASSETILFLRSILAAPVIFVLAYAFDQHASFADLRGSALFLLVNGVLILGLSKIFWIEAIHRIPVTKGQALSSAAPLVTLLFAWLLLNQAPNVWQLASLIPLILGILLLTDHLKLPKSSRGA